MNKFVFYTSFLLCFVLFSCSNNSLLPKQYVEHINNMQNGYLQSDNDAGVKIECLYKPHDFEALTRLRSYNVTQLQIDSVKRELGDNSYYELKIYYDGTNTGDNTYVNYYMEKDLRMVTAKGDSLKPSSYLPEPYNGVMPFQRVLVSFPEKISDANSTIVIRGFKNNRGLKFKYSTQTITEATLKTN